MIEQYGSREVEALPPDGIGSTGRILVLEDDAIISGLWTAVLEVDGYQVVCRESALGLTTLLQQWRPDVILLDLGLPYRSGGSLLGELKEDPATATIPVVVISGAPDSLTRERAAQASAVLTKPVPIQTLLATIRSARRVGGRPPTRRPQGTTGVSGRHDGHDGHNGHNGHAGAALGLAASP